MLPREEVTFMILGLLLARRSGNMAFVAMVGPKTFVSKMSRISDRLGQAASLDSGQVPALLMRMSRRPWARSMEAAAEEIEVSSVTSSWTRLLVPGWALAWMDESAELPLERFREPIMTW